MIDRAKIEDGEALAQKVEGLDGWKHEDGAIKRALVFDNFSRAIAFIEALAPLAEELDHHPEIFNVYDRVELTLTTHDADGLTDHDFTLAAQIDELWREQFDVARPAAFSEGS